MLLQVNECNLGSLNSSSACHDLLSEQNVLFCSTAEGGLIPPQPQHGVMKLCYHRDCLLAAAATAVCVQGGRLSLQDCDVTSNSGVGVGVEGAVVTLEHCNIHDCERHGVAVFGSLEGKKQCGSVYAALCV
jgi:hypothetical protein